MDEFDVLALQSYHQDLNDPAGDWSDILDTAVDLVDRIHEILDFGGNLTEIAAVLKVPVDDVANLIAR